MNPTQTTRRSFLGLLGLPCAGGLFMTNRVAAQAPVASISPAAVQGRDLLGELGVRTFINAGGTFTALTGSLMLPEVQAAMQAASRKFVRLEDLHDAVGNRLAQLLRCEAALVTAGCASAMMLGTAACMTGGDAGRIRRLPDTTGMKNEVIVQRSHRVGYDHAIRNTGARLIEVRTTQELVSAVSARTAMMFFLNASTDQGAIKHDEFVKLARQHKVPTLIDAAADVPPVDNLFRFQKTGFDLVCFSGGKGLRGPQSAGLLLGRKELIAAARLNNSPNGDTIGRTNKVNKEEIIGMLVAVEAFLNRDQEAVWKDWESRCNRITQALRGFKDVRTSIDVPPLANHVPHVHITWDVKRRGVTAAQVVTKLRDGKPSIELAPGAGGRGGAITIGVWMMEPGEDAIVAERVRTVLGGGR
jgi:D-glucosaminate-6-phosphate ammonia-lyase